MKLTIERPEGGVLLAIEAEQGAKLGERVAGELDRQGQGLHALRARRSASGLGLTTYQPAGVTTATE